MPADKLFNKVLIANRGEIAVRIIRACQELQIPTVAVYSEADRASLHVRVADEAYCIGPAPASRSYLRTDTIIEVAKRSGCDAVHPGYGFLSETAAFAELCAAEGITFIGPNPDAIRTMGDKVAARRVAAAQDVPLVPGMLEELKDDGAARQVADTIGYPLMVKAVHGFGGKGMRVVERPEDLARLVRAARSESFNCFGSRAVYLERCIESPRHIEIQIFGDKQGHVVHFMERECSIQHRRQKVIEEAPSTIVDEELRGKLGEAALRIARAVGYDSAGTAEFLVNAATKEFFFLEMNTRLAVEHPVTEAVTGTDLCKEMIRAAAGLPLCFQQQDISFRGHAIECHIHAEDPDHDFFPIAGRIAGLRTPGGPGVRDDSGMYEGLEVPPYYDPHLAKLVVWASTRERCISRTRRALSEYFVKGIKTTIPFCERVMQNEHFIAGDYDTTFIDSRFVKEDAAREKPHQEVALLAVAIKAFRSDQSQTRKSAAISDTTLQAESGWKMSGRIKR
ncbi:acetyl-CoA carboxylase biotin carboxylase subunit [Geomonas azotofigens]|uniref:acetyl-CoA carboxylase biotin carboxylase subunit n=1 Tax=Geomonas azotofigens TaxID=2843196 RepID=UPI001C11492D|nr:acetyl-CoA carboxylase biotin carboxylase subunit [Geomonas azotofigens]MBU5612864.1 acetyl-CoA carboxylase biotin carboxylase subunit [Geomonas azotofigens]